LIFSIGFVAASYSTEIWHLCFTQGIIVGVGFCLIDISTLSLIGQWFTTNKPLAYGIGMSGSGIGQFAMATLTARL
jgi:hypothetical protein